MSVESKRCDYMVDPGTQSRCGEAAKWRTWDGRALCDRDRAVVEDELSDRRTTNQWIIGIDDVRG